MRLPILRAAMTIAKRITILRYCLVQQVLILHNYHWLQQWQNQYIHCILVYCLHPLLPDLNVIVCQIDVIFVLQRKIKFNLISVLSSVACNQNSQLGLSQCILSVAVIVVSPQILLCRGVGVPADFNHKFVSGMNRLELQNFWSRAKWKKSTILHGWVPWF